MATTVVTNANGERVIPATRRPDGTWRKEKKVKDGYTPQDEQPVYQTRGVLVKQGVPLVPGMENAEVLALQATKGKSAKRNEKKKEKKEEEPVQAATQKLKALSVASPAPPPPSQPAVEEEPHVRMEREARKLRKKIRECDVLVERQGKGEQMTGPEAEKLGKLPGWQAELSSLEARISEATR